MNKCFLSKKLSILISVALFVVIDIYLFMDAYKELILSSHEDDIFGNGFIFMFFLLACTPLLVSQLLFLLQINYLTEHKLRGEAKFCVWSATVISALVNLAYILMVFKVFSPFYIIADVKTIEIIVLATPLVSLGLYMLGKGLANRKGKQ